MEIENFDQLSKEIGFVGNRGLDLVFQFFNLKKNTGPEFTESGKNLVNFIYKYHLLKLENTDLIIKSNPISTIPRLEVFVFLCKMFMNKLDWKPLSLSSLYEFENFLGIERLKCFVAYFITVYNKLILVIV